MNGTTPFSISMCVYGKDNPEWFDRALESVVIQQTKKPNEIILVVDGPVPPSIENVITKYSELSNKNGISLLLVRLKENQGQGNARRASIENATNELIALMDSDDVSVPERFAKQISLFDNPTVDCCGGQISEFINDESNVVSYRYVPLLDKDIKKYAKSRCPMNQVTVMFKKSSYNKAGGYVDWFWEEDYYLWLRMILQNMVFTNSDSVFVNVRVGKEMYKRRGGVKYYQSEKRLQKFMLRKKMISLPRYVINCCKRFVVEVLMPNRIRGWIFKKLARTKR